jgi:hypothetical protein
MRGRISAILALSLLASGPLLAATPQELLGRIKAVGTEGKGNASAAAAWRELVELGPPALVPILKELDDNRLVVVNWLRPAVDAIAERVTRGNGKLPTEELEPFLAERANPSLGRALAYDLIVKSDPTAADRWLPKFLDDPSPDLRRAGVTAVLAEGKARLAKRVQTVGLINGCLVSVASGVVFLPKAGKAEMQSIYEKALTAACDPDQVDTCADQLKLLGQAVDVAKKFGFIRQWALVAPFDNTGMAGFAVAYPPEKAVDLTATYMGKDGKKATWGGHASGSARGIVDLKDVLGPLKGTVGYAYTVIDSATERPVEIRLGTDNATKVWLNGKEVFSHEEYHHGMSIDQYSARVTLKAGKNELLMKVCQNEQTENWAQNWRFQVRLCDAAGAAVPFTVVAPEGAVAGQGQPEHPQGPLSGGSHHATISLSGGVGLPPGSASRGRLDRLPRFRGAERLR